MGRLFLACLFVGCGFAPRVTASSDPDAPGIDTDPGTGSGSGSNGGGGGQTVVHLGAADQPKLTGTADLVLGDTTIDTSTGTITPALPAGVASFTAAQDGGGPALFVIHASHITVSAGTTVRATGTAALVLVATQAIQIDGLVDVSANLTTPGAAGYASSGGPGAGNDATGIAGWDTGSAGGSFGTQGGAGGDDTHTPQTGPSPRAVAGDAVLTRLEGGSGGGTPTPMPCTYGGGGGGAIQLTAPVVTVNGIVDAGGGGGQGGTLYVPTHDASSGAGGGAGGAIYIQAMTATGSGRLVANGGGGSGAGCQSCNGGNGADGMPGEDGHRDATPAAGGTSPLGSTVAYGGLGAAAANTATPGAGGGNGGGGGGGAGRIYITVASALLSSPAAIQP